MADERYRLKGTFGAMSASNNTSSCRDCGAVVDDTEAHDRFHELLEDSCERRRG